MANSISTMLMFEGVAEEAMTLYVSLFAESEIISVKKYGPGEMGAEGTIHRADFKLGGHQMICIDSPVKHQFTFTPSASIFVECADEAELDNAYQHLSENGKILMPIGDYGFSKKFCWLNDRYGVSWQLNLV